MRRFGKILTFVLCSAIILVRPPLFPQVQTAPPGLAATLIVKLAAFEKGISNSSTVTIFVLSDPRVAAELEKGIGASVGQSRLSRVISGTRPPAEKPSILFVGREADPVEAVAYSRSHKILSVTATPEWIARGVNLGVGVGNDGKPKVLLNLTATAEENCDWNPAIMKIAKTFR
jgi:hypothetical protein